VFNLRSLNSEFICKGAAKVKQVSESLVDSELVQALYRCVDNVLSEDGVQLARACLQCVGQVAGPVQNQLEHLNSEIELKTVYACQ